MNTKKINKIIFALIALMIFSCAPKLEEVDVLYDKAIKQTFKGSLNSAENYLLQIDENYPYTEYSEKATVLLAYVTYKNKKYSELLPIVDIFIKMNPTNNNIPYLLFIKALSFYDQIKSYKKDKEILYQFMTAFTIMKSQFPNSIYTENLKQKSLFVESVLVAGNLDVAVQYQKNGYCISAINRYLEVMPFAKRSNLELAKHNAEICLKQLKITGYTL